MNVVATHTTGMQWLFEDQISFLWVPSYVEPAEDNLVIDRANPQFAGIQLVIKKNPFVFDYRLPFSERVTQHAQLFNSSSHRLRSKLLHRVVR